MRMANSKFLDKNQSHSSILSFKKKKKKKMDPGLPWWPSSSKFIRQCEGHGLNPWPRNIPHATE